MGSASKTHYCVDHATQFKAYQSATLVPILTDLLCLRVARMHRSQDLANSMPIKNEANRMRMG